MIEHKNRQADRCPSCEVGSLFPTSFVRTTHFRGEELHIPGFEAMECEKCHERSYTPEQLGRNRVRTSGARRTVVDRQRKAENLLSGSDVLRIRERLRLTQAEAAKLFGGGVNAFSKYERDEVIQTYATDCLIRLAEIDPPFVLTHLRRFAGQSELLHTATTSHITRSQDSMNYFVNAVFVGMNQLARIPTRQVSSAPTKNEAPVERAVVCLN